MENKINLIELLKDCPHGMELDCTTFDTKVTFQRIDKTIPTYPIIVQTEHGFEFQLTRYGQLHNIVGAKCVIFPKGKTSWEGFVPPCNCKFNTGDIIFTLCASGNIWISIFKKNVSGVIETYADYYYNTCNNNLDYCVVNIYGTSLCTEKGIATQRLATEEEKAKLLKAIEDKGYRWNTKIKALERFIKPKFKVGDVIQDIDSYRVKITDVCVEDEMYGYESVIAKGIGAIGFDKQDEWELVPNKFDITTLIPFESKVLVRDKNTEEWRGHFFSHYDCNSDRPYVCIGVGGINEYKRCIPYEGNEHLLGKTDDCDEYYKNWK